MTVLGICACGCGQATPLAKRTRPHLGHVKGQPAKYVMGHHGRRPAGLIYEVQDRGFTTPCWIWQRATGANGYGQVRIKDRLVLAHRAMYEQEVGPIPEGLQIDHLCRNPSCVNPEHLEPVTPAENTRRGKLTVLTAAAVREIRAEPRPVGRTRRQALAGKFGVSVKTVEAVIYGSAWPETVR